MSETMVKNAITLKGSEKLISDYLNFGINSILYQRGVYPAESFTPVEHFGLSIYMSTDNEINKFLDSVMSQMKDWLRAEQIKKMSLVIMNVATKEVLERWDFKLEYEKPKKANDFEDLSTHKKSDGMGNKDLKVIQSEIRDVLRQICSTVSFLPLLEPPCSFDLLIHTVPEVEVPDKWGETKPCFISNAQELQLRSFSTSFHRMNTVVSYKSDC